MAQKQAEQAQANQEAKGAEGKESKEKEGKLELKEHINRDRQADLLRNWLDALEGDHDLEVDVLDQHCTIPKSALSKGDARIEYEFDQKKGEYELELTLKWK